MTGKDADTDAAGEAGRWYVRLDSGAADDAALSAWLDERPENERALERVELAVALGRRLAADPSSALHAAAAEAARARPRKRALAPSLAWGGALAAALLVAVFVVRDVGGPPAAPEPVVMEAARIVTFDAPSNSAAVLPSGAVVDASAVAVLPFAAAGDATLARGSRARRRRGAAHGARALRHRRCRRLELRVHRPQPLRARRAARCARHRRCRRRARRRPRACQRAPPRNDDGRDALGCRVRQARRRDSCRSHRDRRARGRGDARFEFACAGRAR